MSNAITIVGAGYVGLSLAALLARKHAVTLLDIDADKVARINRRQSPLDDADIVHSLRHDRLDLTATTDSEQALSTAETIILAVPTNYDESRRQFDTSAIETTLNAVLTHTRTTPLVVIKSTVPIGYTERLRQRFDYPAILFSPEFLREGRALHDNLYPSRIVVGGRDDGAQRFARMLKECALKEDVPILLTGSTEAEAIKLFSNTFLAMRVAFFNEVDTFCARLDLNARDIITGMGLDPRIGDHYNNPSFGYGGYCLPKDTRQTLAHYRQTHTPQALMEAIVRANALRKRFIARDILDRRPKTLGVYRLAMKSGSDNYRNSATLDVLEEIRRLAPTLPIFIYEPLLDSPDALELSGVSLVDSPRTLCDKSDLILANRQEAPLCDDAARLYTRDLFTAD